MDEYRNTLDAAERLGKVDVDGNEIKNLSLEIEKLYTSVNTLHGSRGVNTICITQKFAKSKGGLGMVADSLDSRFLGYAEADVWNTQDKTETISKYLKSKSEQRKGLFLINATAFQQSNTKVEVDKIGGFVETRTHYIDTQEIADNFDRYFGTDKKYGELIRETAIEEHVDSIITNTNESEEVLEDKEKEENFEESKTIEDFDFDDFNL